MSNVSLDETLFYQYMINHNSTSTMLNAISGNRTDDSSSTMASVLNVLQAGNGLGTGSISDVSTLLGLGVDSYSGVGSLDSFSSVLQSYLQGNTTEDVQMTEMLEQVLEEVSGTEEETSRSYQTLQEVYEYFSEKTSGKAANLNAAWGTAGSASRDNGENTTAVTQNMADVSGASFDFDSFEKETDEMVDSLFEEIGISV
ncbi:MAG: hypothetical protein Q4D32_10850 [Eubacteriales bacterium]|nr:hypothetical protein [Eubacteriales bacterium]